MTNAASRSPSPGPGDRLFDLVCAAATAVGAFLLFAVQPMLGKALLPWFGGSPGVWTACLLFFQLVLLAGYAFAHLLARPGLGRAQAPLHVGGLAIALALLPPLPDPTSTPVGAREASLEILVLLARCVGLPYLLLATTAPLVQSWYARRRSGRSPYPLYALSNLGSLGALLAYPFWIEPRLALSSQAQLWSIGFSAYAVLAAAIAISVRRRRVLPAGTGPANTGASPPAHSGEAPTGREYLAWLLLSALGSVMLLAVTAYVCLDVAVVPFLWVVPLALYLLSFVLSFGSRWGSSRQVFAPLTLLAVSAAIFWDLLADLPVVDVGDSLVAEVGVFCLALFAACTLCHGELARRAPAPRYLTAFYLATSAGGALGGILVAVVCPLVFSSYLELSLALLACLLLATVATLRDLRGRGPFRRPALLRVAPVALGLLIGLAFSQEVLDESKGSGTTVFAERSFFGILRVETSDGAAKGPPYVALFHGETLHGLQFRDAALRRVPAAYYDERSGVGLLLGRASPPSPARVGVVGLGAGTLAAYAHPGDLYRFYEIDPAVVVLSRRFFSFLSESPAQIEVVVNDARIALEHEPPQRFDVLVLDAFAGDAVPAHLLTREAFAVYLRHLAPTGVLALHVSNAYLDLARVVEGAAAFHGLATLSIETEDGEAESQAGSDWILASRDLASIDREPLRSHAAPSPQLGSPPAAPVLWTDASSSLFAVLE